MGRGRIRGWATLVAIALAAAIVAAVPAVTPAGADVSDAPGNQPAFRALSAGGTHTCAVLADGSVKCWGNNGNGQLGLGDAANRGDAANGMGDNLPPVDLGTERTATAVSAGSNHTCALLDDATVKCWGMGALLGQGSTATRGDGPGEMGDALPPVDLGTGRSATAVSAGDQMTCALLDNATVKCWGFNGNGQLGLGDTDTRGDTAGEMGDNLLAVSLGPGRTAVTIATGASHACALLDNATVKCWGNNAFGQLGLGNTANRGDAANEMGGNLPTVSLGTGRTATAVAAGTVHTCALLDDSTLKCWGNNAVGQLGLGDVANRGDGANEMGDALPAVSLGTGRTPVAVSGGNNHTCVLLDSGGVKCWGLNSVGALGLGDIANRGDGAGEMGNSLPSVNLGAGRSASALTVGFNHACVLLDDATYKCWGSNTNGRLGLGDTAHRGDGAGEMGDSLPVVHLGQGHAVVEVAVGSSHACALLYDGRVKCWGDNASGQLGLGDTGVRGDAAGEMADDLPAVSLGNNRTAVALAIGSTHTCAILDNGNVKCWGGNANGQLGLGDVASRGDAPGEMGGSLPSVSLGVGRTAVAIDAGADHTCAVLDDATLKCWGSNSSGKLGQGDIANRGDGAGEMGNSLPAISLGNTRTAVAVETGTNHTCTLMDNAKVKCWGANNAGQLGQGDTVQRGDGPGEMGASLPAVDLGTGRTVTSLSGTCALLDDATLKCWGGNVGGVLGLGDTLPRGDGPGEMGDNLPVVDLGTGRTATAVTVGGTFACAVLDDASLKCWGAANNGQIGQGDLVARGDGPGEMGDNLPTVDLGSGRTAAGMSARNTTICALLDTETVKCWGSNSFGRLGLGDSANRGDQAGEMGDDLPFVQLTGVGEGTISGSVTDAVSAAAVPGAYVIAMRTSDFALAGGGEADGSGNFSLDVAAGAYFLYLIDPAGLHVTSFAGPPTRVTVLDGATTETDATMAPTRGSVAGTISQDGGAAIAGSWALSSSMVDGSLERGVVANGSGAYTIPGLTAATHSIIHIDPTGARAPEYLGGSSSFPGNPIAVTAGATTTADGSLPTQTANPGGANLSGAVTQTGTGTGLSGAWVVALRASDFGMARGTLTTPGGAYALNVEPGQYKLAFIDPSGAHAVEWFNDQPAAGLANATSVTAPSLNNAALTRTTGGFSGTVTQQGPATPLPGIWVLAIDATGTIVAGNTTDANGNYTFATLPVGAYRAAFVDPTGAHTLEYWDNSPDYLGGTDITVTPASNVDADAALS